MSEPEKVSAPLAESVRQHLHALAQLLREPHELDSASRVALADLVEELTRALEPGAAPREELTRLTEAAAHFVAAVHLGEERGVLDSARNQFEKAMISAEEHAPLAVGMARRFIHTLANLGI